MTTSSKVLSTPRVIAWAWQDAELVDRMYRTPKVTAAPEGIFIACAFHKDIAPMCRALGGVWQREAEIWAFPADVDQDRLQDLVWAADELLSGPARIAAITLPATGTAYTIGMIRDKIATLEGGTHFGFVMLDRIDAGEATWVSISGADWATVDREMVRAASKIWGRIPEKISQHSKKIYAAMI